MARADLILTLVKASRQGDDLQVRIEEWFRRFQKRHKQPLGLPPRSFAQRLRGLSFAEVEDFGTDILRQITLQQPSADVNTIVERRLRHWKKRYHE